MNEFHLPPAVGELVNRLDARRNGGGFKGLCPPPPDPNPPLSISEGHSCALLKCHAGCDSTAVLDALKLPQAALFDAYWTGEREDRRRGLSVKPKHAKTPPCPPAPEQIRAWQERLLGDESKLAWLHERRGWSRSTLEQLGVGWNGSRLVFPAIDEDGRLVGKVDYHPGPVPDGQRKSYADGSRQLFPAPEALTGNGEE